jgi:hypothetical protein
MRAPSVALSSASHFGSCTRLREASAPARRAVRAAAVLRADERARDPRRDIGLAGRPGRGDPRQHPRELSERDAGTYLPVFAQNAGHLCQVTEVCAAVFSGVRVRPGDCEVLHFSEDPTITEFVPHVAASARVTQAYVWAVDAQRAPSYWFPRQCPRVLTWPIASSASSDVARIIGPSASRVPGARLRRALIYLHGGFSDAREFDRALDAYATHFRVFTPERCGHGRTPDIEGPTASRVAPRTRWPSWRRWSVGAPTSSDTATAPRPRCTWRWSCRTWSAGLS